MPADWLSLEGKVHTFGRVCEGRKLTDILETVWSISKGLGQKKKKDNMLNENCALAFRMIVEEPGLELTYFE